MEWARPADNRYRGDELMSISARWPALGWGFAITLQASGAFAQSEPVSSAFTVSIVDSVAAAYGPSLALAPNGSPCVSYLDLATSRLRFAVRGPSGWVPEMLSSAGYTQTSLALASDGRVLIAFPNSLGAGGGLRLATWEDGQWDYRVVDGGYYAGAWPALVLDTVEQP